MSKGQSLAVTTGMLSPWALSHYVRLQLIGILLETTLRNAVTAVIAMAVAGLPTVAGAADVVAPGVEMPPYLAAPAQTPPATSTPRYYQYNSPLENSPPAAYERPVPYPFRPYTPPPPYANPAPLYCHLDRGEPFWDGHRWFRPLVQICD